MKYLSERKEKVFFFPPPPLPLISIPRVNNNVFFYGGWFEYRRGWDLKDFFFRFDFHLRNEKRFIHQETDR